MKNAITIYVPEDLRERVKILPPRTVSRVCQNALRCAAEEEEKRREEFLADMLAED
jgi:hypothetical protein